MMKFALLCSGSKGNCFVLQDEGTCLMVDCGGSGRYLKEELGKLGIAHEDIDAVLITHTHTDHIAQLRLFADRPLYAAAALPYPYTRLVPGQRITLEHLTVTPLALSHDVPDTLGFIFESWQEKLVYITDTGYVKDAYIPLLRGADYIVLESNHDVEMLMHTSRPQNLKRRIAGDEGHLCNEDCAALLQQIVTSRTRQVILAHISQQANTRGQALSVSRKALEEVGGLSPLLHLAAAGQFETIRGGADEEMDLGSCSCTLGLGRRPEPADFQFEK